MNKAIKNRLDKIQKTIEIKKRLEEKKNFRSEDDIFLDYCFSKIPSDIREKERELLYSSRDKELELFYKEMGGRLPQIYLTNEEIIRYEQCLRKWL